MTTDDNTYTYPVAEIFDSINGEGPLAGQLAVFIRMKGCNLSCGYCDTAWANGPDAPCTPMTLEQILRRTEQSGILNVTVTGGEPLLTPRIDRLFQALAEADRHVEAETNGSVPIAPYTGKAWRPSFAMDYKLPGSGMEDAMCMENFFHLQPADTVKFVCASMDDMERGLAVMKQQRLMGRCRLYFSPVFGSIDPKDMVEFMKAHRLNMVNLQLQLHKYIWPPQMRGV